LLANKNSIDRRLAKFCSDQGLFLLNPEKGERLEREEK